MQLPGQLKNTTLGDLLGALYRDGAFGTLELIEPSGKRHRIDLQRGKVTRVETDGESPLLGDLLDLSALPEMGDGKRLGELLLQSGWVSPEELTDALHQQTLARLETLFEIRDASIRFRAPRPIDADPTAPPPLERNEFLPGRPRTRSRAGGQKFLQRRQTSGAFQVLGLPENATRADIQRAFRSLAQAHHPDRHPDANSHKRKELLQRFAEISRAYHALISAV